MATSMSCKNIWHYYTKIFGIIIQKYLALFYKNIWHDYTPVCCPGSVDLDTRLQTLLRQLWPQL